MGRVLPGLRRLLDRPEPVRGLRVGLVVNPSSITPDLEHAKVALSGRRGVRVTALFGPEHGIVADAQDLVEVGHSRDRETGLPVYSLYGETRVPTPEMLAGVDAMVFDVQDVGSRYYTFVYTMALGMEACGEQGLEFVVLDRPNPIGGVQVEGPVLDPAFRSFVGLYPLAIRHGLTAGELARYFAGECGVRCRVEVVPMKGWHRDMFFDDTELPWIMPSPNIPILDSALVYPGLCLLEGTNVSEGRGTTRPFEMSGAPWIDADQLAKKLNCMRLPGVRFRPIHYIPTFHKWSGSMIGGVHIHVLDRHSFKPFSTGLTLVMAYRELGPGEFRWKEPPYEYEYDKLPIDILLGNGKIREEIERDESLEQIEAGWQDELAAFRRKREKYLLY